MIDLTKDKIQNEAISNWINNNKIGAVEAITGIGKTFMFIKACYTLPKKSNVLFLAEQIDREYDVKKDFKNYLKYFGKDLLKDYNFTFKTYQSAYKLENTNWDFVCADEIHDSLTPEYSKFYFNNNYKYLLGLSATIIKNTKYVIDDVEYTKGDLLEQIAPIVYTYSIDDGQKDGTSRKLDIKVIYNELNSKDRNMKAGTSKKPFYTTELDNYNYWNSQFKKALFINDIKKREFRIRVTSAARAKVLYRLRSKIEQVKHLVYNIKGQSLLFGNDLDTLLEITPNVVCSRYSEKENNQIRQEFESKEINLIGSFKKLKQGANLTGLDNIIIMSYYSTTKDLIQRIGRLRKDGEKIGNVYIFVTRDTQEEVWFERMFETVNSLNITYYNNIMNLIKEL